jgi:hypothetical protein
MENRLLSSVFVALGLASFVAAVSTQEHALGFYTVGSELILYALLITAGIGLQFRSPGGHLLALSWLRAGSLAIFLVPIGIVVWMMTLQQGDGNMLQVLGALLFAVMFLAAGPNKPETSPLWYVVGALAFLAIFSYVCGRLYRRLASPDGDTFESEISPADKRPLVSERARVHLLVVVLLTLALGAQHRIIISEYELPGAMQSARFKDQTRKYADEQAASLVGEPFVVEGGKGLVYVLNNDRGLVYVDLATGKAVRKDLPSEVVAHPYQSSQRPAARFSEGGSLLWSNLNRELIDLHSGRRLKPALEQGYDQYLAVGFVDGSKRLLLFDDVNTRMICLDTATAQLVYSADAAPPGGFSSDQYRQEFRNRIMAQSAFSRDRSRLAWSYLDTLYLMDTATGVMESLSLPDQRDYSVHFSREGGHILTMKAYDTRPGSLIDLSKKSSVQHNIHGIDLLHFSAAEGLIVLMPSTDGNPVENTVMRWGLADLATPIWKVVFNERLHLRASGDGKRLYAYNPTAHQMESAELSGLRGETQPVFMALSVPLPPGSAKQVSYFPESGLLVVAQSPKMALVRMDPSGAVTGSITVDFTQFDVRPKD